jgi:DnaK suppressor protein
MKAAAKKKPATPVRATAKSTSKTTVKPVAKGGVKSPAKAGPPPKVAANAVAKAANSAKPGKSTVKSAAKSAGKPLASSKSVLAKPALKKAATAAKPEVKKSSSSPVTHAASKHAAAKPAPAKSGTTGKLAKPETKSVIKSIPKSSAAPEPKSVASSGKPGATLTLKVDKSAVPVAAPVAAQPGGLLPRPPLKPGRRSSARIASQSPPPAPMVPTHAPDAAKASYSTITERVIAPPPQAAAKKDPKLADNWKTKAGEALTDEEVKAMPDSEYMNDKQMAFFRHKLSVLKQEIHNSAGETTEHLREDTVVVPDPADRATIEEEHALELRTRDRERKLLKKIEQSIGRIDSGDYGYCDETGEAIGVGRLIARPTANLSLEAQQRRELKQKMFGD